MGCGSSTESWLDIDEKLPAGDWVFSPNEKFKLLLKEDGNLVVQHGTEIWWESKTSGSGATHAMLKKDGNFVLLKNDDEVWSLGSAGCGGDKLWVEDDGHVGIFNGDDGKYSLYEEWLGPDEELEKGDWLWSNNGKYKLILQDDGNLVLYDVSGDTEKQLWATGTAGTGADNLWMESDGNLVLYKGDDVVWSSNTSGCGATKMWMEDCGDIGLYYGDNDDCKWSALGK